jgi:HD domain
MDVVDWARNEAQHALRSATRRWAHTQAVAERATEIAGAVAIEDRGTLIAAAYLHDIGYGAELTVTGFHPLDGAVWLRAQGRQRLACLVAHHSGARFEAAARGYAEDLAEFAEERSAVADALVYCDLTTGPTGEPVTVAARLGEIKARYGPTSPVTRAITAATDTLTAAVVRTQARVDALSRAQ